MRKILSFLILLMAFSTCLKAQETPPAFGPNFYKLTTNTPYWDAVGGDYWVYKGAVLGFTRLGGYSKAKAYVDSVAAAKANLNSFNNFTDVNLFHNSVYSYSDFHFSSGTLEVNITPDFTNGLNINLPNVGGGNSSIVLLGPDGNLLSMGGLAYYSGSSQKIEWSGTGHDFNSGADFNSGNFNFNNSFYLNNAPNFQYLPHKSIMVTSPDAGNMVGVIPVDYISTKTQLDSLAAAKANLTGGNTFTGAQIFNDNITFSNSSGSSSLSSGNDGFNIFDWQRNGLTYYNNGVPVFRAAAPGHGADDGYFDLKVALRVRPYLGGLDFATSGYNILLRDNGTQGGGGSVGFIKEVPLNYFAVSSDTYNKDHIDSVDNSAVHKAGTETIAGTKVFTGDVQVQTTPLNANSAASKNYIDNLITGITWKNSVRAKTTGNVALSGIQTIDGVAGLADGRYLVNNETDATQNGIYIMKSGAWVRAGDADSGDEVSTATVAVMAGTVGKNTQWTYVNGDVPVIGTDPITFGQISGAGTYTNGTGLLLSGNAFSLDNSYTDALYPKYTGSYLNPSWIASLAYSKLTGAPTIVSSFTNDAGYLTNTTGDARYLQLTGGTLSGILNSQNILPLSTNIYSLGSSALYWSNVYTSNIISPSTTSALTISAGQAMNLITPNGNSIIFTVGGTSSRFVNATGNFIVGGSIDAGYKLDVQGTLRATSVALFSSQVQATGNITASSGLARTIVLGGVLNASANNDVTVGLDINPTYANGAFTGVSNYAIRTAGAIVPLVNGSYDLGSSSLFWANVYTNTVRSSVYRATSTANGLTFNNSSNTTIFKIFDSSGNLVLQNGGTFTDNGYRLDVQGSLRVSDKFNISTGVNKSAGTVALVAGSATVNTTAVNAGSLIFLTVPTVGGTRGTLSYTISAGTSFTVTSSSSTDTSTISYIIIN